MKCFEYTAELNGYEITSTVGIMHFEGKWMPTLDGNPHSPEYVALCLGIETDQISQMATNAGATLVGIRGRVIVFDYEQDCKDFLSSLEMALKLK